MTNIYYGGALDEKNTNNRSTRSNWFRANC